MKNKKSTRSINARLYLVLIGVPAAAAAACWTLRLDFMVSTLLFFGLPSLYLAVIDKLHAKRAAIFAGCFAIAGIYTDYMAERDLAWAEPHSIFGFRIGGLVPIESLVWFFLLSFLVIMYYEHFFDRSTHRLTGRRMRLLYGIIIVASAGFFIPLLLHLEIPAVSYFYLKLGIFLGLLPLVAFLFEAPKYLGIFLKTAPYFLGLCLLNEFVGLYNGHWIYPGQHFIGWVRLGEFRSLSRSYFLDGHVQLCRYRLF